MISTKSEIIIAARTNIKFYLKKYFKILINDKRTKDSAMGLNFSKTTGKWAKTWDLTETPAITIIILTEYNISYTQFKTKQILWPKNPPLPRHFPC